MAPSISERLDTLVMDWMRTSRFFCRRWMISMDWLSSSHRGIRAYITKQCYIQATCSNRGIQVKFWKKFSVRIFCKKYIVLNKVLLPCIDKIHMIMHFFILCQQKVHKMTLTCSRPLQLFTSFRTFSSARSRERSSRRSLFSRVKMSHLKPRDSRWNSAWQESTW